MKRGGPLKRKTELRADPAKTREWEQRSRRRLPVKSTKQRSIDTERREVTRPAVVARDGERCSARELVPEVRCAAYGGRAELELHEVVKRSAWRAGATVASNCRLLCPAHHDWTEDEPDEARRRGLDAPAPPSEKILGRSAG